MPAVSVILPTHNRPDPVVRAARSVLEQDHTDLELIVVDDASKSRAEETLRPLGDSRVQILRTDSAVGPARARNLGLEVARGAWIAFQDDDDEWLPGKLQKQMAAAENVAADVGVIYCPFWVVRPDGRRQARGRDLDWATGDLHEELLRSNFIGLPTALVRRRCFDELGRFDPALPCFEDWELFIRIASRFGFDRVEEYLVLAHDSPRSVNKASSSLQAEAFGRILDKHREEIERRSDVHAEYLFHIAHHLCLSGQTRSGRTYHGRSFRRRPTIRGAMTLASSFLGGGAYRALARAYDGLRRAG